MHIYVCICMVIYICIYIYTCLCICTYMVYKNTKVRSPDGDRLLWYFRKYSASWYFSPIICLDYMLRTSIDLMKENGFPLAKARSRRYTERTNTDADYADDIALVANTPVQTESPLHSLGNAADGIGLHVKSTCTSIKIKQETPPL